MKIVASVQKTDLTLETAFDMQPGESPLKLCGKGLVLSYTSDSAQTHFKPTTAHKPGKWCFGETCPRPKELSLGWMAEC